VVSWSSAVSACEEGGLWRLPGRWLGRGDLARKTWGLIVDDQKNT